LNVGLTLLLLVTLVPACIALGVVVSFLLPQDEQLEVAAAGLVVVRE
jgi:hypothetical protein